MIDKTIEFLTLEVNKYLNLRFPPASSNAPARLVMGNVAMALDQGNSGGNNPLKNSIIVSLINVEEDRVAKIQENTVKTATTTIYKNPPVLINLYFLFSCNRDDYASSLQLLSGVVLFFQHQSVFTPTTHPSLDQSIKKLMVDLYSLNFEQLNHLWSIMGGKYMPCVLYKVRQLTLQDDAVSAESGLIRDIIFSDKTKFPIS